MPTLLPAKSYTLEKALISIHGASEAVKDTEYFHHDVTLQDIFQCEE